MHRISTAEKSMQEWKAKYNELAESTVRERVEELEERVATADSEVTSVKEKLRELEEAFKKSDADLMAAVADKSRLQDLVERLQVDALDARRAGEAHGRETACREKETEFEGRLPSIRLKSVEDFIQSPVFKMATFTLGANDFLTGWNRAIGQIRLQGAEFDESKLDMALDEEGLAWEEDEEEVLTAEGHEFATVLPMVDEMARSVEEKIQAAKEKARASGINTSDRPQPSGPSGEVVEVVASEGDQA